MKTHETYTVCKTCGREVRLREVHGQATVAVHTDMRGVKRNEGPLAPVCKGSNAKGHSVTATRVAEYLSL